MLANKNNNKKTSHTGTARDPDRPIQSSYPSGRAGGRTAHRMPAPARDGNLSHWHTAATAYSSIPPTVRTHVHPVRAPLSRGGAHGSVTAPWTTSTDLIT